MGDQRLYDLGLLHLKDKPEELAAAIQKGLDKYEERRRKLPAGMETILASAVNDKYEEPRRKLQESLGKTSQKHEEPPKKPNQAGDAPASAPPPTAPRAKQT